MSSTRISTAASRPREYPAIIPISPPTRDADHLGGRADLERDPPPVQQPGEDVVAGRVGADDRSGWRWATATRRMATTTGRLHLTPSSPSTRPEDPPALETPARRAPPADSSCPDATISPTSRPAPTPSEPNRPREKSRLVRLQQPRRKTDRGVTLLQGIARLAIAAPRRVIAVAVLVMIGTAIFGIPVIKSLSAGGGLTPRNRPRRRLLSQKFDQGDMGMVITVTSDGGAESPAARRSAPTSSAAAEFAACRAGAVRVDRAAGRRPRSSARTARRG